MTNGKLKMKLLLEWKSITTKSLCENYYQEMDQSENEKMITGGY